MTTRPRARAAEFGYVTKPRDQKCHLLRHLPRDSGGTQSDALYERAVQLCGDVWAAAGMTRRRVPTRRKPRWTAK